MTVNELTQFRGNFSFVENTYRGILELFDCQQSDITLAFVLQFSVRHGFWLT